MKTRALTAARSGACGSFDAARFKRAFRAAAIRRGIDPAAGSTSFQAANLRADLRKAMQRDANRRFRQPIWWSEPDMWEFCPPYHSPVERAAIERVFFAAYWRSFRRSLRRMEKEEIRGFS
ncbi:MAG: hypothetical protein CUN53_15050 [Phototrophicales bacterium]|nr:MAG: hypothetical protein CUN53_15050 [Phototrophicales bacterium]